MVDSAKPKGGKGGRDPREIARRALAYLDNVLDKELGERQLSTGVAAAGRLLSHVEWLLERELDVRVIQWLGGPERAAQWLAENRERLEAKLKGQQTVSPLALPLESDDDRCPGNPEQRATVGPTPVKVPESLK